ncbi:MAG: DUF362 domain-containing protein [Candidatus Hermodarchaeota archaeon]
MLSQSKSKKPEVAISKADTPKECLKKGIEILGGISKFIDEGDQVFIKFNLNLPAGFPNNTNFEVLEELIILCKQAGAKKIYLGSFPLKGIPIKIISDLFNLKAYFKNLGAELAFLDNSDNFDSKDIKQALLKKIKYDSLTRVDVNGNNIFVPNVVFNSNKLLSVNQVNVDPLFKLNLSILNSYSIVPTKYREIGKKRNKNNGYINRDLYKTDLISNIFDIYKIKQPNLIINDLFYILEGAGPYTYKDSILKKSSLMIMGDNAFNVDFITLNTLNLAESSHDLLKEAEHKNLTSLELSSIRILGEKLEDITFDIELCSLKLEDIKVKNFAINVGKYCSGCFKQAYHLLNFMKTYMVKDLKYNPNNSFLIGKNPSEPKSTRNIWLFGDCAINSTKTSNFRKIIIESKKDLISGTKNRILKQSKNGKKIKEKPNKNILELSGCPPEIIGCLKSILKYFGKQNLPNLNLHTYINSKWVEGELNNKLNIWEAL